MSRIVFDIECNGFLEDLDVVWCITTIDIDTEQRFRFFGDQTVAGDHGSISVGLDYLGKADMVAGHNIIGYDLPAIRKLYDWSLPSTCKVLDTLVWSRTLNPDRKLPQGCPTSLPNPITGRKDRVTPHSLFAWGWRLGYKKVEHHDWKQFSPAMLHRCEIDTEINWRLLYKLWEETNS